MNTLDMMSVSNGANSKLYESTMDIDIIDALDEEVENLFDRTARLAENVKMYDMDGSIYVEFSELYKYMKATNTDIQCALTEAAESNGVDPESVTVIFPSLEATGYVTKDSKEKIKWSSDQIQNTINKGIPCTKCNEVTEMLEYALRDVECDEIEALEEEGLARSDKGTEKLYLLIYKAINFIKKGNLEENIDKRISACEKLLKSLKEEKAHIKKYADPSDQFRKDRIVKNALMAAMVTSILQNIGFAITNGIIRTSLSVIARNAAVVGGATWVANNFISIDKANKMVDKYIKNTEDALTYLKKEKEKIKERKSKKEDK